MPEQTGQYVCEQQPDFVKKNIIPKEKVSCSMSENTEPSETDIISPEEINPPHYTKLGKKRKLDGIEQKILDTLEAPENRHICFFKGIIPSLENLNEEQILQFQMGVLNVLKNVRDGLQSLEPPDLYT